MSNHCNVGDVETTKCSHNASVRIDVRKLFSGYPSQHLIYIFERLAVTAFAKPAMACIYKGTLVTC
jgi:hypothetical protein